TAQLEHPNIVPVHDVGRDAQGRAWLAMKRIGGTSLAALIKTWSTPDGAPLRPEDTNRIVALFNKVADALAFAHSRGVVHRDLKPHNVMVGEFGEVLLVDWGLARPLDARDPTDGDNRPVRSTRRDEAGTGALSVDGDIFGTPAYMPPEQADGRVHDVDERSDIFSLGGVLYHMLTLEQPYSGRTSVEVLAKAVRHALIAPRRRAPRRRIPRELEAIVLKAMAGDPDDRYASVRDLQADLAAWQSLLPTTAWRPGPIERALKFVRRHPMTSLAAALVLMSSQVVLMLAWQLQQAEQGREMERLRAEQAEVLAERNVEGNSMAVMREFEAEFRKDKTLNVTDAETLDRIGPEKVARYMRAYDDLAALRASRGLELTAMEHYHRGVLRFAMHDTDGALADYMRCVDLEPTSVAAMVNISDLLQQRGEWSSTLGWCDRTLRLWNDCYRAWFNRGLAHQALQQMTEALDDFDRAVAIWPDSVQALTQRGAIALDMGRTAEALRDLDRALELDRTYSVARVNRAMARAMSGDPDGALSDVEKALAIRPGELTARTVRGVVHTLHHEDAKAIAEFDAVLAEDPLHLTARFNRGVALLNLRRYDEALAEFATVLSTRPDLPVAHLNRATIFHRLGRFDEAIAECDRVLERDSAHVGALDVRAMCYRSTGDLERAERDLTGALAIEPGNVGLRVKRGHLRLKGNDTAGAREDFDAARKTDPQNADALAGIAAVHQALGELDAATQAAESALAIRDTCADAWFILGVVAAARGRTDDALAAYNRAIAADPQEERALVNRGNIHLARKQYDAALADYSAAIAASPRQSDAFNGRAAIRLQTGDPAAALPDFNAAVRLRPTHADFYYNRAMCKRALTDVTGALADLDEAVRLRPTYWEAWYIRALVVEPTDRNAAIHDLREAHRHCADATWQQRIVARLARLGAAPD
ncbi:MAG: tetratricopeptide repeat protein, partial [Planctomycetota bacterium]